MRSPDALMSNHGYNGYYSSDRSANWATRDASQTREIQYRSISAPASASRRMLTTTARCPRNSLTDVLPHLLATSSLQYNLSHWPLFQSFQYSFMLLQCSTTNNSSENPKNSHIYKDVSRPSSDWEAMALVLPSNAKYWYIFQHIIYVELKIMSMVRI